MAFHLIANHLDGVLEIATDRHADDRGFFEELFLVEPLRELGVTGEFVQDNHSRSTHGVIRGMHYQHTPAMGKLLAVIRGRVQIVEVDIRKDSPTFGKHVSIHVSEDDVKLIWVPPGFANGFCVLSDVADVVYKCTARYDPDGEGAINPLDAALGIKWDVQDPVISARDKASPSLKPL